MRCFVIVSLLLTFVVTPLSAQDRPFPPPRPKQEPKQTGVRARLQQICEQLGLSQEQQQHVEGLWAILDSRAHATAEQLTERLTTIHALGEELRAAVAAGDKQRADELRKQLLALAPGKEAEREFVAGLRPVLSEEQNAKLDRLLQQMESAAQLKLTPIQVVRAAWQTKLNAEQLRQLEVLMQGFRRQIIGVADTDSLKRAELLGKFIADVSAALDARQRTEFEKTLEKLEPNLPAAIDVSPPGSPASKPASTKDQ